MNSRVRLSTKDSRVLKKSLADDTEKSPGCESRSAVEVAVDECNSSVENVFGHYLNNKALFHRIAVTLKSCDQSQTMRDSNTVNSLDKEIATKNRRAWLEF